MKMNKKGFTLIEMLVVIAIIAILVSIVIPTVSNSTTKAKEAADVANIRSAVAQYQINALNGAATWTDPVIKAGTYTAPSSANGMTVKYVATTLTDGNDTTDSTGHTYVWTLGNLLTETTPGSGSTTHTFTDTKNNTSGEAGADTLCDTCGQAQAHANHG